MKYTKVIKRVYGFLLCFALALSIFTADMSAARKENLNSDGNEPEFVDIFVWTEDIPQGSVILEEHVKKITVKNENIPSNVIDNAEEIYAKYAKRDLYENEYASADQLSSAVMQKANFDVLLKPITASTDDYVIVTDYLIPNTGEDLAYFLQMMIDKNPNRTIYFPDGTYVISSPLLTSAIGKESVSIKLSDGAVIKASLLWKNIGGDAMICLGGAAPKNDIVSIGSYYSIMGGTLDANGRTNGIAIYSGRESVIRNICIKNARTGIFIDEGANSGSSDCDFEDITIIGTGRVGSIGIDNKGYDNTFTNIRIYDMVTGFRNNGGGEISSIYVTNTQKSDKNKLKTVGISSGGRLYNCVTENCAVGFEVKGAPIIFDCVSTWTSSEFTTQTMLKISDSNNVFSGCRAYFCDGDGVSANFVTGVQNDKFPILDGCYYESSK